MSSVDPEIIRQINQGHPADDHFLKDATFAAGSSVRAAHDVFRSDLSVEDLLEVETFKNYINGKFSFFGGQRHGLTRFHGRSLGVAVADGALIVLTEKGQWWTGIEDALGGNPDHDFVIYLATISHVKRTAGMLTIETRDFDTFQFELR